MGEELVALAEKAPHVLAKLLGEAADEMAVEAEAAPRPAFWVGRADAAGGPL